MALWGVKSTIGGDAGDLLIRRDLIEQLPQHRRVANVAGRDLSCPDFQCLRVNSDMNLAPDAALCATMLAGVPLAFAFNLDPCAVD